MKLPRSDWRWNLNPHDEVTWNDPDDGLCSRTDKILSICYGPNDSANVTWIDGTSTEVFLRELS